MLRIIEFKQPVHVQGPALEKALRKELGLSELHPLRFTIVRRSVDARKSALFVYTLDIEVAKEDKVLKRGLARRLKIKSVEKEPAYAPVTIRRHPDVRPIVVGLGPAGLFCSLLLARSGLSPLIVERGEPVEKRSLKTQLFFTQGILDTESNVQFGEGGAGAFSDGKVNTLIKDPTHRGRFVMEEFVKAGAPSEILYDAKPHIGTDKLQITVKAMREELLSLGAEIRFQTKLTKIHTENGKLTSVTLRGSGNAESIEPASALFLGTGHSARDTFAMLNESGVHMEQKPFAIGVRIEHPRAMIDRSQYHDFAGDPFLGAASYKLTYHTSNDRSVYTFCMCPGGYVIASGSEKDSVVTNGMSNYARDAENSNSALLVNIDPSDYASFNKEGGVLAGCLFQQKLEHTAFVLGGSDYSAPLQTVGDFLAKKASTKASYGEIAPSYTGKVTETELHELLPDYVSEALEEGIPAFGRKIRGFDRADALLTGVESRSSSPVRINRDESGESISVKGLYPMGEGAGYAGGITSAAIDGMKAAEKYLETLQ